MTEKKIKVLQVNKLYYPHIGGVEKHVQDLAETIKDIVDVRVLVANTAIKSIIEKINGVDVTKVASLGMAASAPVAPTLWRWLKKYPSDINHFHFPYPIGDLSYFLARPAGKLIITYHSDIVRQRRLLALYRPLMVRFLNRADVILAGSPNIIEGSPVLEKYRDKCRIFHYGIDIDRFEINENVEIKASGLRTEFGGGPVLLFIGRLVYYKGVEYLLDAMVDIDAKLVLVGEGELKEVLENKAERLGLKDKVLFYGKASDEDLPALYGACDVFVLPSVARSEAFGLVQLEAHACGKPVVSTDLPTGVPYANLDMRTGLIVPPKDSAALAAAINRLLNDEELRVRLGSQGKQRVKDEFSLKAMKKSVLKVYDEVLGR